MLSTETSLLGLECFSKLRKNKIFEELDRVPEMRELIITRYQTS